MSFTRDTPPPLSKIDVFGDRLRFAYAIYTRDTPLPIRSRLRFSRKLHPSLISNRILILTGLFCDRETSHIIEVSPLIRISNYRVPCPP